jgi:hypothetical protein
MSPEQKPSITLIILSVHVFDNHDHEVMNFDAAGQSVHQLKLNLAILGHE